MSNQLPAPPTHYEVLGLDIDATPGDIKKAYRRLSAIHHPDNAGGNEDTQAKLNAAKETLLDPEKRKHYDKHGTELGRDSIEDSAVTMITTYFNMLIEADNFGGDITATIRKVLVAGHAEVEELIGGNNRKQCKLENQLGRMLRKSGPNYFEKILEDKIEECSKIIEKAERAKKVLDHAGRILQEFEDGRPLPVQGMPTQTYFVSS